MRKSIAILLSMLTLACPLSGCVRNDLGIRLNSDGTGSVSMTLGIEQSAYERFKDAGIDPFDGKSTTSYTDDSGAYVAYTEETEYGTYAEIEKALLELKYDGELTGADDNRIFKSVSIEKNSGIFYSTYTFKATLNAQKSENCNLNDVCKATVTLTMPAHISQSKGGKADGDTIVFGIEDLSVENELAATAEKNNIGVVLGIIAALVVVAAVVVFLVKHRK